MNFEWQVKQDCQSKGWEFLDIERGIVFVKDKSGTVRGITEETFARLLQEKRDGEDKKT